MPARDVANVLGINIDRDALNVIAQRSLEAVTRRDRQMVFACANPHSLVVAEQDAAFRDALTHANIVVADGVGITLCARWMALDVGPRITGMDYFLAVMSALEQRGGRVFFFGSTGAVLERIARRLQREFPGVELCGTLSPPFGAWSQEDNDAMIDAINAARPDVLWVGMTAPKQEKWVQANRGRLNAALIGSIGAVFDFYAETKPRAPQWMCRLGVEWLHRLIREPRRMWQRNFVSTPKFLLLVLRHRRGSRRAALGAR